MCFRTVFPKYWMGNQVVWSLLKVFLPKACVQWSLCRWSLAQLFEATANWVCDEGKLDKYKRSVTYGCDCVTISVMWLDFLYLTGCMLNSRLSRTSLDLNLDFWWTYCFYYRQGRGLYIQIPKLQWCEMMWCAWWEAESVECQSTRTRSTKKETMTNQWVSQAVQWVSQGVTDESEVTKNRMWFVMMGKD